MKVKLKIDGIPQSFQLYNDEDKAKLLADYVDIYQRKAKEKATAAKKKKKKKKARAKATGKKTAGKKETGKKTNGCGKAIMPRVAPG